jgi:hypothetical protein
MLLGLGCGGTSQSPGAARVFTGTAARTGRVSGVVVDDETGAPIAGAEVSVDGQAVRARNDGTFDVDAPAGRVRVTVKGDGFLEGLREVAVGDLSLSLPFKLARRAAAVPVGATGGSIPAREAVLTVPPGAFADGTMVSLTYLDRLRVAVTASSPQFLDTDQTPRRVVATVNLDSSTPPSMPVRVRVPVPADATSDSVRGHTVGASGEWAMPITPLSVGGGFAEFSLNGSTRFGVSIDARKAGGRVVGYLVAEPADSGMRAGDIITASDMTTASRAVAIVDPQGSRIELGPASRARVEVPAGEMPAPASRVAPFAGAAVLSQGQARVVVPKGNDPASIKLTISTPLAKAEVRGTAFALSTCGAGLGEVDVLEVVEGTVDATFGNQTSAVTSGQTATFCARCAAGAAPLCSAGSSDAGPQTDGPGGDAAAFEVAPRGDGSVAADAPVVRLPDGGLPATDAPAPPDGPSFPPDAGAPGPDVFSVSVDLRVAGGDEDAGASALVITPPSADFATTQLDVPSFHVDFTVTNGGPDVTGTPQVMVPAEFVVEANTCLAPLPPQGTCVVTVKMLPTTPGAKSGHLVVSATPGGSTSVPLTGYAADQARIEVTPPFYSFGSVVPGQTSAPVTFTVKNAGGVGAGQPTVFLQGPGLMSFTTTANTCNQLLGSGASCQVTVTFTAPTTPGPVTAQLLVDDMPGGMVQVDLDGNSSSVQVSPASYDFGMTAAAGTAGASTTFTIRNLAATGGEYLDVQATLGGADPDDFIVVTPCASPVAPQGTCSVTIQFKPGTAGAKSAQLDVSASFTGGVFAGHDAAALTGLGL